MHRLITLEISVLFKEFIFICKYDYAETSELELLLIITIA